MLRCCTRSDTGNQPLYCCQSRCSALINVHSRPPCARHYLETFSKHTINALSMQLCRKTTPFHPHLCQQLKPVLAPLRQWHAHRTRDGVVIPHTAASGAAGFPSDADANDAAAKLPAAESQQKKKTILQNIQYFFVGELNTAPSFPASHSSRPSCSNSACISAVQCCAWPNRLWVNSAQQLSSQDTTPFDVQQVMV